MKNMSIRTRLTLGFAIPLILLLIIAATTLLTGSQVEQSFNEVQDDTVPELLALEELRFSSNRIAAASNELILENLLGGEEEGEEGDDSEAEEIANNTAIYEAALETYRESVEEEAEGEELEILGEIETAGAELLAASAALVELSEEGASLEDIAEAREDFEAIEDNLADAVQAAVESEREELFEREADVVTTLDSARAVAVALAVVAVALAFGVALFLYQSIASPVSELKDTADQLRGGKLDVRSQIDSTDEIGDLATSFNAMADQIAANVQSLETQMAETAKARDDALRSDQVKSAFLASMSHELRTPLNAVINFTKFVAKGDMGPINEDQRETLEEVIESAQHLLNLINDVLDMSKIESGSLRLFVDDNVDLNAIIQSVISTGKGLLEDKPIELTSDVPGDLPSVRGDRQRITQILLNMMSNACKFTDKGSVQTRAYQQNGEIVVAIEDTGPGIAQEDSDGVFEPFKQTQSGLRKGGGTGLGMPISRNLAEAHGGRLWLESKPGEGATFFVAIPVRNEQLVPINTTQPKKEAV